MSDENKTEDPIHAKIAEDAALEREKKEVQKKELVVRKRRAESAIDKIEQGDKDDEIAKATSYGSITKEDIETIQRENTEYMLAARAKMRFINKSFDKAIPYFRKNLILIGGKTGEGKSTTVANIVHETISRIDKETKKKRRVLVITNEEKREDVYNRVTCLIKGWHYTNHDKFTDEQLTVFNEYIGHLSNGGMLTVIDDNFNGASGTTTTLEGICQIFDNLIANNEFYDVIIIDYYQNVKESRKNFGMNEWEVQSSLARKLDQYKNIYPAPIVVMAQVQQQDSTKNVPFKTRIEGRKVILNVATCCVEMVANREDLCTDWIIHKSRFNEAVGSSITTGYKNGRYVVYDEEFQANVARMKARKEAEALDRAVKMPVEQTETPAEPVKKEGTNNE